jgi:hypothetical protein
MGTNIKIDIFCCYKNPPTSLRSALFWDIMWRHVVIVYQSFGTTCRSHLHGSRVRVGKKESKPATYNVDSGKYSGVVIRRRDDSQ